MFFGLGNIGLGFGATSAGSIPSTPTAVMTIGSNAVTFTIDGDSGVTNYVKYKAFGDSAWTAGGSRSGDGDVTISGLSDGVDYYFIIYSETDTSLISGPSVIFKASFSTSSTNDNDAELIATAEDFVNSAGEDIVYKPKAGGTRAIKAVVTRFPPAVIDGAPQGTAPKVEIHVVNSTTIGISSNEIDRGGDMVTIAKLISETPADRPIVKVLSQDAGMMKLEIN